MNRTQHRGVVVAKNGIVAASQPLAVSAGLGMLQRGGSFADAALATSAVLAVVEPSASHLGGDAFVIVYDGKTRQTTALNGSGAAPHAASRERFAEGIPIRGLAAASVPGLVAAWFALHDRWGKLSIADVLAPAIAYAENGFPCGYRTSRICRDYAPLLREFPDTAAVLLPNGNAPLPGQTLRQPDLAWTLRQIAQDGQEAFYKGQVAEQIVGYSQANGGLFAAEDLAAHQTQIADPIRTTYRGYTIHGQPPVSQGHILLQELNLVEGFDLAAMGHNSADAIHAQVEAKKLAFADRAAFLGDPAFVDVPLDTLLSKSYAQQRRQEIDMRHAATRIKPGEIHHDTTYFCVADGDGNAVSFIQSVFYVFGSGVIVPGTGVLFNNRMTGFSLDPASPNVLAPGKRTAHTLNAYLITREDEKSGASSPEHPALTDAATPSASSLSSSPSTSPASRLAFVGGTPGADVQVQSNLQVICNVIDFGMNPREAIEAARWQHGPVVTEGSDLQPVGEILSVEQRLAEGVREELERRGHALQWLAPWAHSSSYQLLAVDPESGAYLAGSDPRCDGQAAGF